MSGQYFNDLNDIYLDMAEKIAQQNELLTEKHKKTSVKGDLPTAGEEVKVDGSWHHSGPTGAVGFKSLTNPGVKDKKHLKKGKGSVKKESRNINNLNMKDNTDKSTFDRLFEDVMNDKPDMPVGDMGGDFGGGDAGDDLGVDLGVDGGDEVGGDVKTRLQGIIQELEGVLAELGGGDEDVEDVEDIEDVDGDSDLGGDDLEVPESTDLKAQGDKVSVMTGRNDKVGNLSPNGGKAVVTAGGSGDGTPKAVGDKVSTLTGKNNKVGNMPKNAFSK